jgi:fatty acid desaturase
MSPSTLGVLALTGLASVGTLAAFRSGARGAYKLARQTQEVTRMGGNLLRALITMGVIVGVQWAVLRATTDPRAWAITLSLPALFAGTAITRMFSITEIIHPPEHHGHHRRARR